MNNNNNNMIWPEVIFWLQVVDASARALRMIYQSKLAPKFDVNNNEKNMEFLLTLLNSENENVTELAANIISHSCDSTTEQLALCAAGVPQRLVNHFGGSMNLRDACLDSLTEIIRNNWEVASRFALLDHGKALRSIVALIHDRSPRTRLLACLCLIALSHASPCHFQDRQIKTKLILVLLELIEEPGHVGDDAPLALTTLIKDSVELQKQALSTNAVQKLSNHLIANSLESRRAVTILLALAELCSKLEESRSQLMSVQVRAGLWMVYWSLLLFALWVKFCRVHLLLLLSNLWQENILTPWAPGV